MNSTIKIDGIELQVEWDFQPFEAQTLEHEGCDAYFTIEDVSINGVGIYPLLSDSVLDEIKIKLQSE